MMFVALVTLFLTACGGKKSDMARYEAQIDSIRKAEQLKEMKRSAGVYDDPVEAFYDTLQLTPLPIQSAGDDIGALGHFTDLPLSVVSSLDYPVETTLRMLLLPRYHGFGIILLAEGKKSEVPLLTLVTLDRQWQPIDELTLYEEVGEERGDDYVTTYMDYFIDNHYNITLMYYYRQEGSETPHLESTQYFFINDKGYFDEKVLVK